MELQIHLQFEEESQRWWADIPEVPGVSCYAPSAVEGIKKIKLLAFQVIADLVEHGEMQIPDEVRFVQPVQPLVA